VAIWLKRWSFTQRTWVQVRCHPYDSPVALGRALGQNVKPLFAVKMAEKT